MLHPSSLYYNHVLLLRGSFRLAWWIMPDTRLIALSLLHNSISTSPRSPYRLVHSSPSLTLTVAHGVVLPHLRSACVPSSFDASSPPPLRSFSPFFILSVSLTPIRFPSGNRHHLSWSVISSLRLRKRPQTKLHCVIILSHFSLSPSSFHISSPLSLTQQAPCSLCVCVCVTVNLSVLLSAWHHHRDGFSLPRVSWQPTGS